MDTIAQPRMRSSRAPRKDSGVRPVHDPYHVASAWTYRTLCSRKRLAIAWRVDIRTAGRYRNGQIVGSLTRLVWEVILLERYGIRTDRVWRLVRRAAERERRIYWTRMARRVS